MWKKCTCDDMMRSILEKKGLHFHEMTFVGSGTFWTTQVWRHFEDEGHLPFRGIGRGRGGGRGDVLTPFVAPPVSPLPLEFARVGKRPAPFT